MTLALLFPGQGAQHPEMLRWLDESPQAQPALARMASAIGADWRTRVADADWSERNSIAQPSLTGLCIAAWNVLEGQLPLPVAIAGYSVGELAAYAAAGALEGADAQRLAVCRAQAMDRCAGTASAGLLSVTRIAALDVEAVCARLGLELAIRIGPDRVLVGGASDVLDSAARELIGRGGECKRLRVQVASHTSQMEPAAAEFAALLAGTRWSVPRTPLVTCFRGRATRAIDDLRRDLAAQIAHTVQWQRCLDTLAERRPRCVLEVGPGTTLARMWAAAHPEIPVRSIDEFGSAAAVVAWVRESRAD